MEEDRLYISTRVNIAYYKSKPKMYVSKINDEIAATLSYTDGRHNADIAFMGVDAVENMIYHLQCLRFDMIKKANEE